MQKYALSFRRDCERHGAKEGSRLQFNELVVRSVNNHTN